MCSCVDLISLILISKTSAMAIGLKAVNGYQKRPNETMQLIMGLSSVPPGTSGAKPGHLGVPKTTFGIPGQSVPNWDCPGKTRTVSQLA